MRTIIGLGNIGHRYEGTRHNIGFAVVDGLIERWGGRFLERRKFLEAIIEDQGCRLIKPLTYMNRSGEIFKEVGLTEQSDLLVVCDDFQLPWGVLRLRPEGSSGGHKGLLSIEEALGSRDWPRLRIGVGPLPEHEDPADFVLRKIEPQRRQEWGEIVSRACDAVDAWVHRPIEEVMSRFNKRKGVWTNTN